MKRYILIATAFAFLLTFSGGCPMDQPDKSPETLTLRTTAPVETEVGYVVELKVSWPDDVDATTLSVHWYQTFGRQIEIMNADKAVANFTAPSLESDQTFTFRVDVETTAGKVFSKTITILVKADPKYTSSENNDSDDTETDMHPVVLIATSMGNITVTLNREKAPLTVNNFLRYVDDDFYDGTLFHRVIEDFMIQGGGYDEDLQIKSTRPSILNESDNGLSNLRGTISMAHSSDPDSATSQFFINLVDNTHLDYDGNQHAVFGEVTDGMSVVDAIGAVETETRDSMSDVPKVNVVVHSITRVGDSGSETDGKTDKTGIVGG